MSEPAYEQPITDESQGTADFEPSTASEPAESQAPWSKYLEGIPSSLHSVVEQKFREWDGDTTRRFQKVHSEYEPLKPYQPLAEAGYDPDQLLQLAETLNSNPRQVYEALVANFGEEWGIGSEQGQQDDGDDEEFLQSVDPKYAELQSTVDTMADILLERHRSEQAFQEDQQLDQYLGALSQQYGEFNERVVLGLMNAGLSGEDAVAEYQQSIEAAMSQRNRPSPPRILGSGGGVPTESADLSTPTSRKQIIAQMLANAQREG